MVVVLVATFDSSTWPDPLEVSELPTKDEFWTRDEFCADAPPNDDTEIEPIIKLAIKAAWTDFFIIPSLLIAF